MSVLTTKSNNYKQKFIIITRPIIANPFRASNVIYMSLVRNRKHYYNSEQELTIHSIPTIKKQITPSLLQSYYDLFKYDTVHYWYPQVLTKYLSVIFSKKDITRDNRRGGWYCVCPHLFFKLILKKTSIFDCFFDRLLIVG